MIDAPITEPFLSARGAYSAYYYPSLRFTAPIQRAAWPTWIPWNIAGEIGNTPMQDVFDKWRQKYGAWNDSPAMFVTKLIMGKLPRSVILLLSPSNLNSGQDFS